MKTSLVEWTSLQRRIFRFLCKRAGDAPNQSEIAREVGASPAGVARALDMLAREGYIDVNEDPRMNLKQVSLSRNRDVLSIKQSENFLQVHESGLVDRLEQLYPGTTIILFGSYSRGEDTVRSDIDIAVIGGDPADGDLSVFEQALSRPIRINHYSALSEVHKDLRENLCNGIVLVGGIVL